MNAATFLRLLKNAGYHPIGADSSYIIIEDPACILRSFETFIEYAWLAIAFVTGVLLFGWTISIIRGAGIWPVVTGVRNLLIIFGTLTATGPILNVIYGDDLIARGCREVKIPMSEVNKLLDARDKKMKSQDQSFEEINIYDSGVPLGASTDMQTTDETVIDGGATDTTTGTPNGTSNAHGGNRATRAEMTKSPSGGRQITYTYPDGTRVQRSGGTRSWRNNNPGNIMAGKFSAANGGIGSDGRFAVFPDEETGLRAIGALLRTSTYNSLTLERALAKWAPPNENDTRKVQQNVTNWSGVSLNRNIRDMTDDELMRIARALQKNEGWVFGAEHRLK